MLRSFDEPGRRVAGVADGVVAGERLQRLVGEDVGHEPGLLVHPGPVAVADGDAGGLLAAVLQGEQPEERQLGDALAVRRRDPEHPALFYGCVVDDVELPFWTRVAGRRFVTRSMRSSTGSAGLERQRR